MVVGRRPDEENFGQCEFLKWFTARAQSCFLHCFRLSPPRKANDMEQIEKSESALNDTMKQILTGGLLPSTPASSIQHRLFQVQTMPDPYWNIP